MRCLSLARCFCLAFLFLPTGLSADQVKLETALANPTMKAGEEGKQLNYLKIGLRGFELAKQESKKRAPVNVAIVIDKSGSMSGDKIKGAKHAALEAIRRLDENDIVSIVAYDSDVSVLLPATKASDQAAIRKAIEQIEAGGSTALFAGVSKGAAEVRKFKGDQRVNRVILLSDGLANVGPSTPDSLAELGSSLLEEGITVSTLGLGLGYNEDLMTRLAAASSGNHVFIEDIESIAAVFQNEFDDVLSVVAKDFRIKVRLQDGIRPVRLLSSTGDIEGQSVELRLGQLYSRQQRFYLLEVEVPSKEHGTEMPLGTVEVIYNNLITETRDELSSKVAVRFDKSTEKVTSLENIDVLTQCAIMTCNDRNRLATELRDKGDVGEAKKLLIDNAMQLKELRGRIQGREGYGAVAPQLEYGIENNEKQSQDVSGSDWNRSRKSMREVQNMTEQQQSYGGRGKVEIFKDKK